MGVFFPVHFPLPQQNTKGWVLYKGKSLFTVLEAEILRSGRLLSLASYEGFMVDGVTIAGAPKRVITW
jgi:hypothetical protein